jgi:hypothetical protein
MGVRGNLKFVDGARQALKRWRHSKKGERMKAFKAFTLLGRQASSDHQSLLNADAI